jgi:hypothetical protein
MATNPESILDSIKKVLGFDADYTAFDIDIIMHINTMFGIIRDLGAGPQTGFVISDNTSLWSDFSPDMILLAPVKSFIYLKIRLMFDPSTNRWAIQSTDNLIAELEWRIQHVAEIINPPSDPLPVPQDTLDEGDDDIIEGWLYGGY